MLNIVVINYDNRYEEYEWNSIKEFISDMDNTFENIPEFDNALVEVNTDREELRLWWENTICNTVYDLYEECWSELGL